MANNPYWCDEHKHYVTSPCAAVKHLQLKIGADLNSMKENPVKSLKIDGKMPEKPWWAINKVWLSKPSSKGTKHQVNLNLNRLFFNRQIGVWAEFKQDSPGWIAWFELNLWWARFKFQVIW